MKKKTIVTSTTNCINPSADANDTAATLEAFVSCFDDTVLTDTELIQRILTESLKAFLGIPNHHNEYREPIKLLSGVKSIDPNESILHFLHYTLVTIEDASEDIRFTTLDDILSQRCQNLRDTIFGSCVHAYSKENSSDSTSATRIALVLQENKDAIMDKSRLASKFDYACSVLELVELDQLKISDFLK